MICCAMGHRFYINKLSVLTAGILLLSGCGRSGWPNQTSTTTKTGTQEDNKLDLVAVPDDWI